MDDQEASGSSSSNQLQSGTRVRFATPTFVVRGEVLAHRPPSLTIKTDDGQRRVIPLADWYLEQPSDAPEHICVITDDERDSFIPDRSLDASDAFLFVREAAEMARVEEKQLRRYIRKGQLEAHKDNGMWLVKRDTFLDFAREHGWL